MNESLETTLLNLPGSPGVYLMKNENDTILYVGKARVLKNRVRSYFQNQKNHDNKTKMLVTKIKKIEYIVTRSEEEALLLECNLIKRFKPFYNIRLKDDKRYPYVKITLKDDYPRLEVTRKVEEDGSRYFGPFTNSVVLWDTVRLLSKAFRLRTCKSFNPKALRPCLNYDMGRCSAPCMQYITKEAYAKNMEEVVLYFQGRRESLRQLLKSKMEKASQDLAFEKAAEYRDQLSVIKENLGNQLADFATDTKDMDIINYYVAERKICAMAFFVREGKLIGQDHFLMTGEGEKETILSQFIEQFYAIQQTIPPVILIPHAIEEGDWILKWLSDKRGKKTVFEIPQRGKKKELIDFVAKNAEATFLKDVSQEEKNLLGPKLLQEALGLKTLPHRFEAYDISNTQGSDVVASMVVFEGGVPNTREYRRFKIRTVEGLPDDFKSMEEVISRRFMALLNEEGKFTHRPDVVLIDGGKGQLGRAKAVMDRLGFSDITVFGLAKREEEIFLPEKDVPILLAKNSEALYFIQRIRNEAHRFAITYHRKLRSKRTLRSALDDIPAVGKKRKDALLKHFGSMKAIKEASMEDLRQVLPKNAAESVFRYFEREKIL